MSRVVLGVAGSGKTLIAAEKARRLAAQGFDVLLTCFNRPLAEHLAGTIGRTPGVTVSTFHGLAAAHMQAYADAFCWRYNHRMSASPAADLLEEVCIMHVPRGDIPGMAAIWS